MAKKYHATHELHYTFKIIQKLTMKHSKCSFPKKISSILTTSVYFVELFSIDKDIFKNIICYISEDIYYYKVLFKIKNICHWFRKQFHR